MKDKVEELLIQFEEDFKQNPQWRIEDAFGGPDFIDEISAIASEKLSESDVDRLFRELILLEIDLRFAAGQSIDRHDYQKRFPEYESIVDQAVDRVLKPASTELSGADIQDETLQFQGTNENLIMTLTGPQEIPQSVGRFQDIEFVGSGTFGIVCRATDSTCNDIRALKFPKAHADRGTELIELLRKETEKAIKLDHPHIVKTLGFESIDSYVFVVQHFVDGSDLKATIHSERPMTEQLELVAKVADALNAAHQELQIFHCDLKPANILMGPGDHPYVADFGLAFRESEQLDMPNQQCGTPYYMSPQLVRGLIRDIDGRTDIFSLGVILYELLTKRKPFRGHTRNEIFRQIEEKDPTSPKNYNDEVDDELDRIVFKCLAKPARERYSTARDLAEDIRYWIARHTQPGRQPTQLPTEPASAFVPKGLRSYGSEDSEFFLELLPGPRVRDSFPVSIQFWTQRICEPVPDEDRVPVGFIFGPSGSGKSSFVKAGLLPQLDDSIESVYIESTVNDTEVRLFKALRKRFKDIPNDISLPELFSGLSRQKWRSVDQSEKKILIVIDQFEQRLSQSDPYSRSQLVKALQHCDGERIQCILLCRDDFWLAATRFADGLELDIREAQNSQSIDLFDRDHAQKVLIKLGQAYERLPAGEQALSDDENQFIDLALDQLAEDHFVVCVRLTLFAEMFKHRRWTVDELNRVGGVAGVGQQFLESNFGQQSLQTRYRSQRQKVQAILEELLPESGRDIRGSMKSREELLQAANCEDQASTFDAVLRILDDDLKLVTRTDPDASDRSQHGEQTFYQLTHDYLVPSIRSWLYTELKNNRRGRALIRLRELASQVIPGQPPRYLPSNLEWLYWRFRISDQVKTDQEKQVFSTARSRFAKSAAWTLAVFALVVTALLVFNWRQQKWNHANQLVENLTNYDISRLPSILKEMEGERDLVSQVLDRRELGQVGPIDRAAIAQAYLQNEYQSLLELLLLENERSPRELEALTKVIDLSDQKSKFVDYLYRTIEQEELEPISRFRAIVAAAQLDPIPNKVDPWSRSVIQSLVREPDTWRQGWIGLLGPLGKNLIQATREIFAETTNANDCQTLAQAVVRFSDRKQLAGTLTDLLGDANANQFAALMGVIEENGLQEGMLAELRIRQQQKNAPGPTASYAAAQLRMGQHEPMLSQLAAKDNRVAKPYLVFATDSVRMDFKKLQVLWEQAKLAQNPDIRFWVLIGLAERIDELSAHDHEAEIRWLIENVVSTYGGEKDGGCFACLELIVKRLAPKTELQTIQQFRKARLQNSKNGVHGEIYLSRELIPFRIFRASETDLDYSFAVSLYEISNKELNIHLKFPSTKGENRPAILDSLKTAVKFCVAVSENNDLDPCLTLNDENDRPSFDHEQNGFRVLRDPEWRIVSRDRKPNSDFGEQYIFADRFIWSQLNSQVGSRREPHDVGTLLPNRFGLFDLFGNAGELVIRESEKSFRFFSPGGNCGTQPSATGRNYQPVTTVLPIFFFGFRMVRAMK